MQANPGADDLDGIAIDHTCLTGDVLRTGRDGEDEKTEKAENQGSPQLPSPYLTQGKVNR